MDVRTDFPRPVCERLALWIPLADGRRLAARMWLPRDAGDDPVPALVEAIPYRRLDGTIGGDARTHPWWAGHGYAAIRLDLAGSGDSCGILLDEYLESEQDDICAALAWIAAQPWCNGATGMVGISWGGFAALQIAARRPPSLRAIVTCCSTDDRFGDDVHYMGGCLLNDNVSWGAGIFSCVSRWPDPHVVGDRWRDMWKRRLEETGCPLIEWTRHQRRDGFWKHGSISEDYASVAAAVLCVGGWTDGYTNALLRMTTHLPGPKRALVGPWTHLYPHFGTPGEPMGFLQEALRWWDRWLKGVGNGIDDEPALALWMQEDLRAHPMHPRLGGRWISERTWPASGDTRVLHLGDGILADEPQRSGAFSHSSALACGLAGGEWCPRDGGGVGPEFQADQRADDMLSLCFDSAPLAAAVEVLGAPEVSLRLASDRPQAMIAVRLNEVLPCGRSSRVSFGLLNLSHRRGSERPEAMVPGRTERVTVRLNDTGYRFGRGNRIRLAVSTSYWPMAWPPPEPVTLTVDCAGSALSLPLRDHGAHEAPPPRFEAAQGAPAHPIEILEPPRSLLTLTRDIGEGRMVLHRDETSGRRLIEDIDLTVAGGCEEIFSIVEGDPASARTETVRIASAERGAWRVRTETRLVFFCDRRNFHIEASLRAFEGATRICERRWNETVPRDHM